MKDGANETKKSYQPGDTYEIPVEGSLGLLALGHIGLKLWREKRAEYFAQIKNKSTVNNPKDLNHNG